MKINNFEIVREKLEKKLFGVLLVYFKSKLVTG